MDFLSKGYQAIRSTLPSSSSSEPTKHASSSSSAGAASLQQVNETIDKLCDRISHSTMIEDRRASVLGLKALSRDYQLEVGTRAMSVLIRVLSLDKLDVESVRAALETLTNICKSSTNTIEENLGANFSEIFMKDAENISLLLEFLKVPDFHIRLQTIYCISSLAKNQTKHIQERILEEPLGISLLVDLLDDGRDIIRNEALLLLISLTKSHTDLQKLVAFQNAFEKLFDIIVEEGDSDGGVITSDCIQLISNLVKNNVSNQNHFRETNSMQRVANFLKIFPRETTSLDDKDLPKEPLHKWHKQKILNILAMIDLIGIFVERHNPTTHTNQNVIRQFGVLQTILAIGFHQEFPVSIRIRVFFVIGDCIRSNSLNQEQFQLVQPVDSKLDDSVSISNRNSTDYLIGLTIDEQTDFNLRIASLYALESYLYKNSGAQIALLTSMMTFPNEANSSTCLKKKLIDLLLDSTELCEISRKNPFPSWCSCVLLSHCLQSNHKSKLLALNSVLPQNDSDEDSLPTLSLLSAITHSLMFSSQDNVDLRIQLGFLSLLCIWLYDCSEAVAEFLKESANLQFLIETIKRSSGVDPLSQGLASLLLGLCIKFNKDSVSSFTKETLKDIIMTRIGIDTFLARMGFVRSLEIFINPPAYFKPIGIDMNGIPTLYLDSDFIEFFRKSSDLIENLFDTNHDDTNNDTSKFPWNSTNDQDLEKEESQRQIHTLLETIKEKDQEIKALTRQIEDLSQSLTRRESSPQEPSDLTEKHPHPPQTPRQVNFISLKEESPSSLLNLSISNPELKETSFQSLYDEVCSENGILREHIQNLIQLESRNHELETQLRQEQQRFKTLENDHEDLLICLAQQEVELSALKKATFETSSYIPSQTRSETSSPDTSSFSLI